jgi:hypothetical protein
MTKENDQKNLEEIEEKFKLEESEKKKTKMPVSGKSVFDIQRIKKDSKMARNEY